MTGDPNDLIERLVADLKPAPPLRRRDGLTLGVLSLVLGAVAVVGVLGLRTDLRSGHLGATFALTAALFLSLALAATWATVDMARPFVGARRSVWTWLAAPAGLLPGLALGVALGPALSGQPASIDMSGLSCLLVGVGAGLITGLALVMWLRRGAPASPSRAGLMAGIAAGAAGAFAVSLHCPQDGLLHNGLWHGGAVVLAGWAGRTWLPRVLAW